MTGAKPHGQVRYEVIGGFPTPVRYEYTPAIILAHLEGFDRFGDCTNLIHFKQHRVGGFGFDASCHYGRIGTVQIVTN
eukprot:CAMPEP_0204855194 /NCGR_PEP_ID=MMETSP1347-20130617/16351_1 /ASSEMBLY_ACC=CAM_ASM_000690 /TAXON_ID=215587 /ORGANISM="Aplanochytrium stocchinoi, Strain GSBS06" /LENGTH=77 /DNA_ID=CAMNT_0052001173 /DNA_START=262 /DNA_END=492 /DNA_ORIENTATION=-